MNVRKMDYHVHTLFSYDGEQSMDEMCRSMVDRGVQEVCLTEHLDLGHPDEECQGIPAWDIWNQEIQYCRAKYPMLIIRRGIEMADNPACRDEIKAYVASMPWDFVLLSLHLVDGVDPYNRDVFFRDKDRSEVYGRYLEAIHDAVMYYEDYDAVAHIGYISRYAPWSDDEKAVQYSDQRECVDSILRRITEKGKCLEINTKGYRKDTLIPDDSIIKRYMQLGGEFFTFGSDAHKTDQNYQSIEEARRHVRDLGGKYQVGYENRKPVIMPI